jgi:uncharacterized protein YbjT (DUF2867 family)
MPSPSPTILVVGATGNTGRATVRTLSADLAGQNVRILGLTRSVDSEPAQELRKLPLVEIGGKYWPEIDAAWLRDRNVVKAFVAVSPSDAQFTDESLLYRALLEARVEYVVRISTWAPYIGPASPIFYGRSHWALETMLEDPSFDALMWTSLRPTVFSRQMVEPAAEAIKKYRSTGSFGHVSLWLAADLPGAWIEPDDVGKIAGKLLALADPSPHASQKYVINGPEDITGNDIIAEMERLTGGKVTDVSFGSDDIFNSFRENGVPEKLIRSLRTAIGMFLDGKARFSEVEPTAQSIMDLAPPTTTCRETLRYLAGEK